MKFNENLSPMEHPDAPPIPEGSRLEKAGDYLRIVNAEGHPLAGYSRGYKGTMPYHRFVCFESMGRPEASACVHCGYVLPWKTTLTPAQPQVVNVDHLDGDKSNNDPANLAPSCGWCNANRSWAESAPEFWERWRKWMSDVPPIYRPNLVLIAPDFGVETPFADNGQTTDKSTDTSANGHTDKRPYSYTAASVRSGGGKLRTTDIHENDFDEAKLYSGLVDIANEVLTDDQSITLAELVAAIQTEFFVSKRTAMAMVCMMRQRSIVFKFGGLYRLCNKAVA